jgi:hypothetical protein
MEKNDKNWGRNQWIGDQKKWYNELMKEKVGCLKK